MKRDWLVIYTDLELMVLRKIFELKTNLQIGNELGCSPKSVNIRILNIYKKMGIKSGIASKNLILHHFGVRNSIYLDKIRNFEPEPTATSSPNSKGKLLSNMPENYKREINLKIKFILENTQTYTAAHLSTITVDYLNRIYKDIIKEARKKEEDRPKMKIIMDPQPLLPIGYPHASSNTGDQVNTDLTRILLLFPKQLNHKYKHEDGRSE